MNAQTSHENIELAVRGVIAESLAIDIETVATHVSLMNELGVESLDFLDIVFKLERLYDIQITRGELEHAARGSMSEEEFAPNGVISEVGLSRLRELMPEAAERIKPGLRPVQILTLFTVQTLVRLVENKLPQTPA